MPEVGRDEKYVVVIFPKDHTPAHVHVFFDDCEVRVLFTETTVEFDSVVHGKPKRQERKAALQIVADNVAACVAKWRAIHGKL